MCGTPDWDSDNLSETSTTERSAHDESTPASGRIDLKQHYGDGAVHIGGPVLQSPFLYNLLVLDHRQHLAGNAAIHEIKL
jgi:hypothetical protein